MIGDDVIHICENGPGESTTAAAPINLDVVMGVACGGNHTVGTGRGIKVHGQWPVVFNSTATQNIS